MIGRIRGNNKIIAPGCVSCGGKKEEVFRIGYNNAMRFQSGGYHIVPSHNDGRHERNVWSRSAYEFLQLVFRTNG